MWGGASTRPGASAPSLQEEIDRTIPVLEKIQDLPVRLSIDTYHAAVAKEAIALGVNLINDVSGGSDIKMLELVKQPGVEIILMHMQGKPQNMQTKPEYKTGVVREVSLYLKNRVAAFTEAGIHRSKLWVDPGIGFGKTTTHNLTLLKGLRSLREIGGRLVIGTSRKSFLANILEDPNTPMELRAEGTLATNLWAYQQGVSVFRVHEVGTMKRALQSWEAVCLA